MASIRQRPPSSLNPDSYPTGAATAADARDESAFYRTVEPVHGLRLEVWMRRLAAPSSVAGDTSTRLPPREPDGSFRMQEEAREGENFVVATFSWQEKAFGPRETVKYARAARQRAADGSKQLGRTYAEDKYVSFFRSDVLQGDNSLFSDVRGLWLYTYVDEDNFGGSSGTPLLDPNTGIEPGIGGGKGALARRRGAAAGLEQSGWASASHKASTMWLMAAVELDKEEFRSQGEPDKLPVSEMPLCMIRAYAHDNLMESRPPLSERENPDSLRDALLSAARMREGTKEGEEVEDFGEDEEEMDEFGDDDDDDDVDGKEGKEGKEKEESREGKRGREMTGGQIARASTAWHMFRGRRTYVFTTKSGGVYEYFVTNSATATLERAQALASAAAQGPAKMGKLLALAGVAAALGVESGDALGAAEQSAKAELSNRVRTGAVREAGPGQEMLVLACEIVAAVDFGTVAGSGDVSSMLWGGGDAGMDECDAVFVTYEVALPEGWTLEDTGENRVEGVTQLASADRRKWNWTAFESGRSGSSANIASWSATRFAAALQTTQNTRSTSSTDPSFSAVTSSYLTSASEEHWVAHLNAPLELRILRPLGSGTDNITDAVAPSFVASVYSRDSMGRCRVMGYASASLPLGVGSHSLRLATWRPKKSIRASMQDFFLGGASRVVPRRSSHRGAPATSASAPKVSLPLVGEGGNKYGVRTEAGGSLALRADVAIVGTVTTPQTLPPPILRWAEEVAIGQERRLAQNAPVRESDDLTARSSAILARSMRAGGGMDRGSVQELIATSRMLRQRAAATISAHTASVRPPPAPPLNSSLSGRRSFRRQPQGPTPPEQIASPPQPTPITRPGTAVPAVDDVIPEEDN